MLAELDQMDTVSLIYHIFASIGYIFLFLLITGKFKKRKKEQNKNKLFGSLMALFFYNKLIRIINNIKKFKSI